ncbi:hypothetical protein [Pseudophaeobacter leonis]|uniref:hypothetical protein n=1 Tax=Pseudophaeobacter leonis TaxID=1144477 RepID=UPI0009F3D5A8|nr:hypothetical protein [Pseudophaeobacter leonis]
MSSVKIEGDELKKFIQLAKKGPLPFGFCPGKKDPDHVLAIHRSKKPAQLGKLAKAEGSGGKFAYGTFVVEAKVAVLTCEQALPGLAKKLKKYLKTQKIPLNVVVLDAQGQELEQEVEPEEAAQPEVAAPPAFEEKPVADVAEPETLADEEDEADDDDPITGQTQGDELRKLIRLGKKMPLPFGFCPGADVETHVIVIHRRKKPAILGKRAKSFGEGGKTAFGTFTVAGKVMVLTCESVVPAMSRTLRKYLAFQNIQMKIVILDSDGQKLEQDTDDLPEEQLPLDDKLKAALAEVSRQLDGTTIPASASDQERQKYQAGPRSAARDAWVSCHSR